MERRFSKNLREAREFNERVAAAKRQRDMKMKGEKKERRRIARMFETLQEQERPYRTPEQQRIPEYKTPAEMYDRKKQAGALRQEYDEALNRRDMRRAMIDANAGGSAARTLNMDDNLLLSP